MPSVSNSNYRLGATRLTIKSIGTNAMMAAALLVITVASRASADEVARWNQIATDATVWPKLTRSRKVASSRSCTLQFTMPQMPLSLAMSHISRGHPRHRPPPQSRQPSPGPRTTHWSLCFRSRK